MKKIIALSVMFVLSIGLYTATQTKAANTNVTLAITAGTLSCTAPTSIDLGSYSAQVASHTESGSTWVGSLFECTDLKAGASWDIAIVGSGTSGLVAGSYNIPRTSVTVNAGTPALVDGACTYSSAG